MDGHFFDKIEKSVEGLVPKECGYTIETFNTGDIVPTNRSYTILKIKCPGFTAEELRKKFEEVQIRIMYSSIYGDNYIYDTEND